MTTAGTEAIVAKGWLRAHKWLLLRRLSQWVVLSLFLVGPWFGLWIVKGNLNYSETLDFLPLTDPYVLTQSLAAGQMPAAEALIGVALVLLAYLFFGGRSYCAWICPVNPVTDLAHWVRVRLGIKGSAHVSRATRFWILAMTFAVAALTGSIAWEMLNPVSMLHRGLIFGLGFAWAIILAVFLFDVFVMRRGWCGHLCPVGAFYSLVGKVAVVRVLLPKRDACNDCMDCFAVCPEQQVIRPALKGLHGTPAVILESQCTNCGRCVDVCAKDVFQLGTRFGHPTLYLPINPDASGKPSMSAGHL
jgi:ferredoxin-type protein NapH